MTAQVKHESLRKLAPANSINAANLLITEDVFHHAHNGAKVSRVVYQHFGAVRDIIVKRGQHICKQRNKQVSHSFLPTTDLIVPSKYNSAPALKVLWMSSKACHIVGDIDFEAKVQLSIISNTSLYRSVEIY